MLPGDKLWPRLLLCPSEGETRPPWKVVRVLHLSQKRKSALPILPRGVISLICEHHLADPHCWADTTQPGAAVRALCGTLSGPWTSNAPLSVRWWPQDASVPVGEILSRAMGWLVGQLLS